MQNRPKLIAFLISIVFMLIALLVYQKIPFLNIIELKSIDARFLARGNIKPSSKIVLAVVDEKSIAKEGKWIWPRSKFAKLVNRLSDAGARVIAFDIGFLEADDKRILDVIDNISETVREQNNNNNKIIRHLDNLKIELDNDKMLATAIKNSKAHIVLGYFFRFDNEILIQDEDHIPGQERSQASRKQIELHIKNIEGSKYTIIQSGPNAQRLDFTNALAVQSNISEISRSSRYSGYFNKVPDKEDGVVRRMDLLIKFQENMYAPLSLIAASLYLNKPLSVTINDLGIEDVKIGELSIPTDYGGRLFINYRGGKSTFPKYSITDILDGSIAQKHFKDKIVLVSATATGINDVQVTPMNEASPGAEIHASIIDNILSNDFLTIPWWSGLADIASIILTALFLGLMLHRAGAISGAIITIIIILFFFFFSYYLFVEKGWILNLVYLISLTLLIYLSITGFKYFNESQQKRIIKNVFSTYLAPSVVKHLLQFPEKLKLGGEEREIIAFFSDVEGFTSISEKLSPNELVELLNEFLTEMTDIITKYEGTVDKFEGDAIIAFFGAPNDIVNKEEIACRVCIEMQEKLKILRKKWKSENRPGLKMRIGLYSGPAIVGNMGSKNRMDYTMIGDTVNTAARLESVNKIYGIYTLTGEAVANMVDDNIIMREIDSIFVIGKAEPLNIYQIVDYRKNIDHKLLRVLEHYGKGLSAYKNHNWDLAINFFRSALTIIPDDGPSIEMLTRCNEFKHSPPGDDWSGVYTMKSK